MTTSLLRLSPWLCAIVLGVGVRGQPGTAGKVEEMTFVANAENLTTPAVRYTGTPWTADAGGFLRGTGRGKRLLAVRALSAGDFRAEFELRLVAPKRESAVVLGLDSELAFAASAASWQLRGRFFRASDRPVTIAAPGLKAGQRFKLTIERIGVEVTVAVDGVLIHRGGCSRGELGALGLDPGTGTVNLYGFSARGSFAGDELALKPFGNPFGLQLRSVPSEPKAVYAPVIIREAVTNESSMIRRRDGTLEIYSVTKPASDSVSVMRSRDGGLTWSEPDADLVLPGKAYYAVQALEAADGVVHIVVHIAGDGPGGYHGRLYEVYHATLPLGSGKWTEPQRVVPGYVGSIRGFIQLRSGRILLAVGRAIPAREQPPATAPDLGWNDTFVYLSDDQGRTWRASPDQLSIELKTANATRYGAVEPALLELRDGRVWMLVRDRQGRLFQSFSRDGERWSPLTRTDLISSDSPAALLRLSSGKILLLVNGCQNWSDPRSYAMGGREVLHAAISADEGTTWSGFREILHETNLVSGGDRGTAYATAAENTLGKVVVVSGQGEGKRAVVSFDPRWLEERQVRDDLTNGPVGWTQFGDDGIRSEPTAEGARVAAIAVKADGLCGALWNFPSAVAGELRLRLRLPDQAQHVRLALTDHFSRIDDRRATEHAVFAIEAEKLGLVGDGHWRDLVIRWGKTTAMGELLVEVDGKVVTLASAHRAAPFGVNYLRIEFRGGSDEGHVAVGEVSVQLK